MLETYKYKLLTCFFVSLSALHSIAQTDWKSLGVDELFEQAKTKAFNSQRVEAREMLQHILTKSPDYHDVRILLARTYAWDSDYTSARTELQRVLSSDPENLDALSALIDTELWSDNYASALQTADVALQKYPGNKDFLFKKATALNNLKREDEALDLLQQILTIDPGYEQAANLQQSIKSNKMKYIAGVSYSLDIFSRTFDPAHYASAQLARLTSWGSVIGRINYSHRFAANGVQPEIDLYPRIANGMYAYLNYGYSSSDLFPQHRAGAELYKSLPKSLEASIGARYLFFDAGSRVTIFTGSVGWYFKNYWLSVRPYITPDKETGTSYSAAVTLRRYFADANTFISVTGGAGYSPDDRRIQNANGLSGDQIYLLKSQRMGMSFQKTVKTTWTLFGGFDLVNQELAFDVGNYVVISSINAGVRKRF